MARYTGPDCRLCRREGCKLFLKGDKCFSEKCVMIKRPVPPGIHGVSRRKPTAYSSQLREKQKTKRIYGLTEKQFRSYYDKAATMRGATGEIMLSLLERRLDNVVYRMGIGISRAQSRQIVNHGHITVNGKNVDIPSYQVKVGDIVEIKETKKDLPFFADLKSAKMNNRFKWLEFKPEELKGTILALPAREDIDMSIAEHLIVELYSK